MRTLAALPERDEDARAAQHLTGRAAGIATALGIPLVFALSLLTNAGAAASVLRAVAVPFVVLTIWRFPRWLQNPSPEARAYLLGSASISVLLLGLGFFR